MQIILHCQRVQEYVNEGKYYKRNLGNPYTFHTTSEDDHPENIGAAIYSAAKNHQIGDLRDVHKVTAQNGQELPFSFDFFFDLAEENPVMVRGR